MLSRITWHGISILTETEAIYAKTKCSNDLEKLGLLKKNGSENGFRMKKLWLFEEKLMKAPTKCGNVRK